MRPKRRRSASADWEHIRFVESDQKQGKEYAIERRRTDGAWRCACESFRFTKGEIGSPGKLCKHLRAWLNIPAPPVGDVQVFVQDLVQPQPLARGVRVAGETFTFRRAMSLTGLGA